MDRTEKEEILYEDLKNVQHFVDVQDGVNNVYTVNHSIHLLAGISEEQGIEAVKVITIQNGNGNYRVSLNTERQI